MGLTRISLLVVRAWRRQPLFRGSPARRGLLAAALTVLVATGGCTSTGPVGTASNGFSTAGGVVSARTSETTAVTTPVHPTGSPSTSGGSGSRSSTTSRRASTTTTRSGTCVAGRCYILGPLHELPTGVAPESSGIAASATSPGVFFVVDDGTGADQIVAVRSDGSLVAKIGVRSMSARNAEALAAGPCGDRPGRCIYVGDIGDNGLQRRHINIYRLSEPGVTPAPTKPVPADRWDYTYPDGPHNAEAMIVDASGSLIVVTKSAPDDTTGTVPPHRIYRGSPGGGQLRFVSSFTPPQPVQPLQSVFTGTVVTDAGYAGGRLLLLTYDEVIEYVAPTPTADPAGFPSWPHHSLPAPPMIQSEGITPDIDGCGYEVTSEQGPGGTHAGLAGVSCE